MARGARPLIARRRRLTSHGIPAGSLTVARGVLDAVACPFVDGSLLDEPGVLRTALAALPARAERISGGFVDGAHTAASVAALARALARRGRDVVVVVALRSDKDLAGVAAAILKYLDPKRVVCCSCGDGFVAADALAEAFPAADVAASVVDALGAVPCDASYVRIALGSFELAALARGAWGPS